MYTHVIVSECVCSRDILRDNECVTDGKWYIKVCQLSVLRCTLHAH